jgi:NADPH-dependent glutamate synthase beta subunit-like oxidoreductase
MNNGGPGKAQCRAACPAGVDVPRYIRHIREGDFGAALAVIREKIPFPAVCGYACMHPCEAKCARVQYDEPVAIRMLKRAAWEYSAEQRVETATAPPTGKRVAVVGAGPCGLTAGYFLAGLGHQVTVFEALPAPGGMLRYGIPGYRLPKDVLNKEISLIAQRGVKIVTNTRITSPEELLDRGFDAVLVAVGAWKGAKLGIEGEEDARVVDALSFLQAANSGNPPAIGKKVVVVGGGNTALDAARTAVRLGAEVTIIYRRIRAQMPAHPEEVEAALEEGVRIEFLTVPKRLQDGQLTCIRVALGPPDASGRPNLVPVEGSEFQLECDTVIAAVGQVVEALGLEGGAGETVKVDPATFATRKRGVFAAGDAVTGPSSIIEAIAQGRQASIAIDKFLGGAGVIDPAGEEPPARVLPDTAPRGTGRPATEKLPLKLRLDSFDLVERGYDREAAMAEARRCLGCDAREFQVEVNFDICKGCGYCKEVCSLGVFEISESFNLQGYRPAAVTRAEKCVGCLRCLYVCPDFAISVESARAT